MIPYVDSRFLDKGVGFFISHAQQLLGGETLPTEERLALISATAKFASPDTEVLTSALEQQALRRLFRVALRLAQEARVDRRWQSWKAMGFSTDPIPELEAVSHLSEGIPYESRDTSSQSGRKAA